VQVMHPRSGFLARVWAQIMLDAARISDAAAIRLWRAGILSNQNALRLWHTGDTLSHAALRELRRRRSR
jgi:hypothetical protein